MRIVFDSMDKVCVMDTTLEEVNENFPKEEFPYLMETEDGGFILYRR